MFRLPTDFVQSLSENKKKTVNVQVDIWQAFNSHVDLKQHTSGQLLRSN